jgi:hypothetical protein
MQELISLFILHKFILMRSGIIPGMNSGWGMAEDNWFGFINTLRGYQ